VTRIRVAIVDDQTLIREGLASLLALIPDLEVAGKAADGQGAIDLVAAQRPDVVLMDVRMPGMNGVAATRAIHAGHPETRVIVLTTFDDDEYLFEALRAGAAGYLLKNADPDHLAAAIRAVHAGQGALDPAVTGRVIARMTTGAGHEAEPALTERLTGRERDVLRHMAAGLANAEIAGRLALSEGTVKNHVSRILDKLGARDRAHVVRLAVEWGLVLD
jgi:DNA-binding NarL/FixJ family response regulator